MPIIEFENQEGVPEFLVRENIALRQKVEQLQVRIEELEIKRNEELIRASSFLAQFYRAIASTIDEDWSLYGSHVGWSPDQIAIASTIAAAMKADMHSRARNYDMIEQARNTE